MKERKYKYLFGPVLSRRLGHSLGVDLVPLKTCSYDCIYCQVGKTTDKTIVRKEYVPLEDVLAELKEKLSEKPKIDYITLSGSGEPTLYSRIGELIARIRKMTRVPVAVLTNGSLLWDPEVRQSLLEAHVVAPSLDAGSRKLFREVNRPHPDITFEKMIQGLIEFRKEYKYQIWLEVFLLRDLTADKEEVEKIASFVKQIKPDRIQLNTVARPPLEKFARAIEKNEMSEFIKIFGKKAEIIVDFPEAEKGDAQSVTEDDILNLLKRRPCSIEDIAKGLSIHPIAALKHLDNLLAKKLIKVERIKDSDFYSAK
jgi:wyosine [tRNA(Phe)-imidazoG37] synthetase (radical SAM superfamily)